MTRIRTRKHYLTTAKRAAKASRQRYIKGVQFVDPFPNIDGTIPEKIVYRELSHRSVPFAFQNEVTFNIPEIDLVKDYRPDIVLPTLRIIIEVQGSYWHSTDQAIQDDAFKDSIYEMCGWRVLNWWDYDILSGVGELFAHDPVLSVYNYDTTHTGSTEYVYQTKIVRDDAVGILTNNHKTMLKYAWKRPAVRQRIKTR